MLTVVVVLVALLASIWDVFTYRIPNWLTFGAMFLGLSMSLFGVGAVGGIVGSLQGALIGLAVMLPLFLIGAMGGGDVKLVAAFGALGGVSFVINTLLIGSVLGGMFALVYLLFYKKLGKTIKRICFNMVALLMFKINNIMSDGNDKESVVPYGVFISAGAVLSFFCEVIKVVG